MSENPLPFRLHIARAGLAALVLLPALLLAVPRFASGTVRVPSDPSGSPALRLIINIPAYRLDVYEGDALRTSYPVTVGKDTDPTPDGAYTLRSITWNPWWRPPYNRKPKDHDTPPGPRNPMGKVKLNFTSMYYLHGTPKLQEIGEARSRGCVRLRNQDAVALAEIVHRYAAPLSDQELASLEGTRSWRTHEYPLHKPVSVEIRYDLVEVRDGKLIVHRDIYRQARETVAEAATRALATAGYPPQQVDAEALQRALGADGAGEVPVEAVLGADAASGATMTTASTSTPH